MVFSYEEMKERQRKGGITASYRQQALRRWPQAEWVSGRGRFALLAWCGVLTVTLWLTRAKAEGEKQVIDTTACGSRCSRNHEIIDLSIAASPWG